jgi:protein-S-isoprenylcysteine O-methyltransferase Ste14
MLPFALYQVWTAYHQSPRPEWQDWAAPFLQVLGLVMQSSIYYMRAITEERHLERDAEYRIYAKKVRYRFVPGLF